MRKINTRNYRLATRATPREVNRRIVLNLIREHQPISRAELARRMNVRRAALTAIVRDLLQAGDVYETGPAASVRGRRPTLIRVQTERAPRSGRRRSPGKDVDRARGLQRSGARPACVRHAPRTG